jgi:hypothetical protein
MMGGGGYLRRLPLGGWPLGGFGLLPGPAARGGQARGWGRGAGEEKSFCLGPSQKPLAFFRSDHLTIWICYVIYTFPVISEDHDDAHTKALGEVLTIAAEIENRLVIAPKGKLDAPNAQVPNAADEVQFPGTFAADMTEKPDFHVVLLASDQVHISKPKLF